VKSSTRQLGGYGAALESRFISVARGCHPKSGKPAVGEQIQRVHHVLSASASCPIFEAGQLSSATLISQDFQEFKVQLVRAHYGDEGGQVALVREMAANAWITHVVGDYSKTSRHENRPGAFFSQRCCEILVQSQMLAICLWDIRQRLANSGHSYPFTCPWR
jgi:hypothetical protein